MGGAPEEQKRDAGHDAGRDAGVAPYRDPLKPIDARILPDRRKRNDLLIALISSIVGAAVAFGGTQLVEASDASSSCGAAAAHDQDRREAVTDRLENGSQGPRPRRFPPYASPSLSTDGALTVVCLPKCSSIIDNGKQIGPGHIFNRPAASGRHELILSSPNGVSKTMSIDVAPDQVREVRVSMATPTDP